MSRKSKVKVGCDNCGKEIVRSPSQIGPFNYCDNKCQMSKNYKSYICRWLEGVEDGIVMNGLSVSSHIKKYIRIRDVECTGCGQDSIWNGKRLVLEIDHIDGNSKNNTKENLRLLCPNCHTQTSTYKAKNRGNSTRIR